MLAEVDSRCGGCVGIGGDWHGIGRRSGDGGGTGIILCGGLGVGGFLGVGAECRGLTL